jgi:hypothetical protein
MIRAFYTFVDQHPGWSWVGIVGTALASWIAPIAGLVTIALGLLKGYIEWQKYKEWRKDNAS